MERTQPQITIVICSRNRATSLRETLEAIAACDIPKDWATELLVVDNGSIDDTANVLSSIQFSRISFRAVDEPRIGVSYARNAAVREARGEVMLCTDDDVRPSVNWVRAMCTPILSGDADAVAGRVHIARHLQRPWLTCVHRRWLAEVPELAATREWVGANMAMRRDLFRMVPGFDPSLGPGASGFGEESLLFYQLREIKCRFVDGGEDSVVEHHFDPARLSRDAFLRDARKRGASCAYIQHHWHHGRSWGAPVRAAHAACRLTMTRAALWVGGAEKDVVSVDELECVMRCSYYIALLRYYGKERNYERQGMVKLRGNCDRVSV
jgi:glycosyltransferase involved in cell wall biosynthesis